MGASLALAAYQMYPDLDHAAMRVLVFMALTAKDNDTTPTYWGGRDALVAAIGHSTVDVFAESTGPRDAAYRAVRRAIRLLTVAKAIRLINRPAPGRNAKYALHLSMEQGTPGVPRSAPTGDAGRPPLTRPARTTADGTGDTSGRNRGRLVVATGDAQRPPEETVGVVGDNFLGRTQLTGNAPTADDPKTVSRSNVDDNPTTPVPPLRVVASNPSPPVVTTTARQPALWPAPVPNTKEDPVRADEARELAREALKGHSRRPITRAGRERERAAQLGKPTAAVVSAPLIGAGTTSTPQRKGFGFCWLCHDEGRVTLAADQVNGDRCERHMTASAVAS